jgi:starch phosphorylase
LPVVVVTLLSRQGYFRQEIDAAGRQHEHPVSWSPADHMKLMGPLVRVQIEGRLVQVQAWRYDVASLGIPGVVVPVYFLDTDVEGNDPATGHHRRALRRDDACLKQEVISASAGCACSRRSGTACASTMNEGHAAC